MNAISRRISPFHEPLFIKIVIEHKYLFAANSAGVQSSSKVASSSVTTVSGNLSVTYIDVGQGDSELIQQGDQDMLIDTGTNESESALINYIKPRIHGKLEYLVLTHPHEDHIGGSDKVINSFNIGTVYMPNKSTTTKTFESVLTALQSKGLKYSQPALGSSFNLGSANCSVYGPVGIDASNINTYSIVIKVTFGSNKFLFTGDAQEYNETSMITKGFDLSADVLKVGHHGSNTSTCLDFLNAVKPKYAVIEAGEGNSYGHPTQTTLTRLHAANITVYRTDLDGSIIATSDGKSITFNKQPSANEYTGANSGSKPSGTTSKASASQSNQKGRIVYWTPGGKSYHYNSNCPTLSRSKTILSGTISEAIAAGKSDPCDRCVK